MTWQRHPRRVPLVKDASASAVNRPSARGAWVRELSHTLRLRLLTRQHASDAKAVGATRSYVVPVATEVGLEAGIAMSGALTAQVVRQQKDTNAPPVTATAFSRN